MAVVVLDHSGQVRSTAIVEVRWVEEEASQGGRPILSGSRSCRIVSIGPDLARVMQDRYRAVWTAEHVGEVRGLVASGAAGLFVEEMLPSRRRRSIESAARGL